MSWNRRRFLRTAAGTVAAASLATKAPHLFSQPADAALNLPNPANSGINHVVVIMMENRSYDHFFGWMPNSNVKQHNTFVDPAGVAHHTYPLAPDYTGCGHNDPDHSYSGARIQYDGGKMDGFLKDTKNDIYSIGYYNAQDLPFYSSLALNYTTFDHYFCSFLGPTFPNRVFAHAAQTDRTSNTTTISSLPTIWDELAAKNISAKYYYSNVPFLALWGTKYLGISRLYQEFLVDAATGNLPAYSFIDPRYTVLDDGTGNDDHPHADIRAGDQFLQQTFEAIANSPAWPSTVVVITFDEWGGFFEHVAPPRVAPGNSYIDTDQVNGKVLLGFRVPVTVASPFTRGNPSNPRVNHSLFDHTSVLKLLEWRFGLSPLTPRDASSQITNLAQALNLNNPNPKLPALASASTYPILPCPQGTVGTAGDTFFGEAEFADLQKLAQSEGFSIG